MYVAHEGACNGHLIYNFHLLILKLYVGAIEMAIVIIVWRDVRVEMDLVPPPM